MKLGQPRRDVACFGNCNSVDTLDDSKSYSMLSSQFRDCKPAIGLQERR